MKTQELLQAEGRELSQLLGEVFQTEICLECSLNPKTCGHFPGCSDFFIQLTPANAFKWRDWAVDNFGKWRFSDALKKIAIKRLNPDAHWNYVDVIAHSKPKHYLKAAALCVLKEQEDERSTHNPRQ